MRYPFTPELLDALPEELAELFRELEITLLERICSQLKNAGEFNEVSVQGIRALRSHGIDLPEIKKAISEAAGIGEKKLEKLLDYVVERNRQYYTELIDLAQVTAPEALVDAAAIEAIRRQTLETYRNLTNTMGFVLGSGQKLIEPTQAYRRALDNAALQVQSGAVSYTQAISNAVRQLARSGVKTVSYDSKYPDRRGRVDQIDVAVRRAVMTATNQICQQYASQSAEYLGTDLVQTSAHRGARNIDGPHGWENHEKWQGRIFRWKEKKSKRESFTWYPDFEESCGIGDVTGIGGANCRHTYGPFVEGVMEPTYTEAELNALKAENFTFEFEGKIYDGYTSTQKQRQIERTVRAWKREKAAFESAGDTESAAAAQARIRRLSKQYTAFSKAAGLPEQRERMQVLYD